MVVVTAAAAAVSGSSYKLPPPSVSASCLYRRRFEDLVGEKVTLKWRVETANMVMGTSFITFVLADWSSALPRSLLHLPPLTKKHIHITKSFFYLFLRHEKHPRASSTLVHIKSISLSDLRTPVHSKPPPPPLFFFPFTF